MPTSVWWPPTCFMLMSAALMTVLPRDKMFIHVKIEMAGGVGFHEIYSHSQGPLGPGHFSALDAI